MFSMKEKKEGRRKENQPLKLHHRVGDEIEDNNAAMTAGCFLVMVWIFGYPCVGNTGVFELLLTQQ